ncbi:MAG: hypothetical protein ABIH83_05470 [Candidatus Micrarchaeota archaeon]
MGKITVGVDDETEKRFCQIAEREYGAGKENLERAFSEALRNWSKK